MSKQVQWRRGTATQNNAFTGAAGEVTVDTTGNSLRVHDGAAAGGFETARKTALDNHVAATDNPHEVTKAQVGLGSVDNVSAASLRDRSTHTGTQSLDTVTETASKKILTSAERTKLAGVATGATANSTDATLLARANHTGTQSLDTITETAGKKVMTSAERDKLAGLEGSKFVGTYINAAALLAAHPSPAVGSYGYVDDGAQSTLLYIWDADDSEWVDAGASGSSETSATIKSKYEANANTNAYTDAEKTKLAGVATGATANSSDADLRDRSTHTGLQAISTVTNLQVTLDEKASLAFVNARIDQSEVLPEFVPVVQDEGDNVAVWLDNGNLDAVDVGPVLSGKISSRAIVGESVGRHALVTDGTDEDANVIVWTDAGKLDAAGLGSTLMASLTETFGGDEYPLSTDGLHVSSTRARLANLLGTTPTVQLHIAMVGDSWTERTIIPQAISDKFQTSGHTVVASGWIGFGATTSQLLQMDGASVAFAGDPSLVDADVPAPGQFGPDGLRRTFADGDTGQGVTINWTGKTLTVYHLLNGATFTHQTDGGGAVAVTLAASGLTGKTVIDAGSEGAHETTISRPTATGDLETYGSFAASDLSGLTLSKMGNSNSTMADIALVMATDAAAYVMEDIAADTVRMSWLTNDSRMDASVSIAVDAMEDLVQAYRTARPGCEILFSFPLRNSISGISNGFDLSEYFPGIYALADTYGFEIANWSKIAPAYADCPQLWQDTLHLGGNGGGPDWIASYEFNQFWRT